MNELICLNTDGKEWEIQGKIENWEDLFLRKENFAQILENVKALAKGLIADPLTPEGSIAIKSLAKKIGKLSRDIEDRGKSVAAELKTKPKIVDATRKEVRDTLESCKEKVLKPIVEIEDRKKSIDEMIDLPAQGIGCDESGIITILEQLNGMYTSRADWKESAKDALYAKQESERQLNEMLKAEKKKKADAVELEERRRKEAEALELKAKLSEEARIKAEADKAEAEKARAESERKSQEAEKARDEAERIAQEAERKAQELIKAAETGKHIENKLTDVVNPNSRRIINREALESLMHSVIISEDTAKAVITAIAYGKVKYITLNYGEAK